MTAPDPKLLSAYFHLMNANGVVRVYRAGLELGLFAALLRGPRTAEELCVACGTQVTPTQLLLQALCAIGVVESTSPAFRLSEVGRMLHLSEYRELGDPYWNHLVAFLRSGEPIKRMDDVTRSEEYYQSQAAILGRMLTPAAEAAVMALGVGSQRANMAVLDVGAGSGIWSLTLARHDPETRVTAVDWPAVLEVAQETAENLGVADQLTTIAGNYHAVELPQRAFDLAIAANVTHLETVEGNIALFQRLHASLKSGGELVIVDALPGNSEGNTPFTLYQLGLALRTEKGRVYSKAELDAMLDTAQFHRSEFIPLNVPPYMVGMLLAKKRA